MSARRYYLAPPRYKRSHPLMGTPRISTRPCAACGTTEKGLRRLDLCDLCYTRPTPATVQPRYADGKHAPTVSAGVCPCEINGHVCGRPMVGGAEGCYRCLQRRAGRELR